METFDDRSSSWPHAQHVDSWYDPSLLLLPPASTPSSSMRMLPSLSEDTFLDFLFKDSTSATPFEVPEEGEGFLAVARFASTLLLALAADDDDDGDEYDATT